MFNLLSTYPIPTNLTTARLMKCEYVAALIRHQEREFVMSGLWALTGFKQVPITVNKHHKGESSLDSDANFHISSTRSPRSVVNLWFSFFILGLSLSSFQV